MAQIISVHSYHDGTGKSTVAANLGAIMAIQGLRVCIVDADIQSPSLQALFNLGEANNKPSLYDYLWGKCDIEDAVCDVTNLLDLKIKGQIYLLFPGTRAGDVSRMMRDGYDLTLLYAGFKHLITSLNLDILLIDIHAGLNEDSLVTIGISDILVEIIRPDQQDYMGTGVVMEIIRTFDIPKIFLIINQIPRSIDFEEVHSRVEQIYNCEVGAMLPFSEEIIGKSGIFSLQNPDHQITLELNKFADSIIKLPRLVSSRDNNSVQRYILHPFPEGHEKPNSLLNKHLVTVTLTAESWKAIMDFVKYSCQLKGQDWVPWGQGVNQIIQSSIEKSGEENLVTGIKRTAVSSSDLNSVGYDVKTKTLEIKFNGGSIYQYYQVPQETYVGLMKAELHGRYFYAVIRSAFQFRKVGYEPLQNYGKDDDYSGEDSDASDLKSELKADVGMDMPDDAFDAWYDELGSNND